MIIIEHSDSAITITGHAGYAEIGNDIVCAAVSALVYAFLSSVEEFTNDKIEYSLVPGETEIQHGELSEWGKLLRKSFLHSVALIAEQYAGYIKLEKA